VIGEPPRTGKEVRTPSTDEAIARLAGRQHGLVKTAQLLRLGVAYRAIHARVERGVLHRKYRGVYSVGHAAPSRSATLLAPVLAAGDGAALGYDGAVEVLRLSRRRAKRIDVVSAKERRIPGVRVHVSRTLTPRDVVIVDGIPVTTVARTLVDLTDTHTAEELVAVIHEAAFRGIFSLPATLDAMERNRGRHRLHVLDEALGLYFAGSAGLKSGHEKAFLALCAAADIPKPLVNHRVNGHEVDFHWPNLKLIVEVDGLHHRRAPTRRDDARRDADHAAAGWAVTRVEAEDLERRPRVIVSRVARARAARG
jgi:hypothetical protein